MILAGTGCACENILVGRSSTGMPWQATRKTWGDEIC